jgi:phosphate/sulfate permease
MGIVGMTVYISLIISIIRRSWSVFKRTKDIFYKWFSASIFAGMIGMILLSFFSASITKYNLNAMLALLIAVIELEALRLDKEQNNI